MSYDVRNVDYAPHTPVTKSVEKGKTKENENVKAKDDASATYEKGVEEKKATYTINKMSEEDRAALVEQLKNDQEARTSQLLNIVSDMMGKQAKTFGNATNMWRFLASGNYEVDPQTKAQAKEDISENGYWGVKQTSQRLFDFASALAGDDVEKMKKMEAAMEKGFDMATKTWGGALPSICRETIDATHEMFEEYYASKGTE